MPSTYTSNNGIEKIATGEQSGTWGETTNLNLDILDQSLDGFAVETLASAGTSGAPNTINIADGSISVGRNRFITFNDGGDLGGDVFVQLTPNDAEKWIYVTNSLTTQDLILFQGNYDAGRAVTVPNGVSSIVQFDGNGVTATAATFSFSDGSSPGSFTTLTASGATTLGVVTATGTATFSTVDINGGAIDGAAVGGSTPAAGSFTTLTASGDVAFDTDGFFFDQSTSRVGIGTNTPDTPLEVLGTATSSTDIATFSNSSGSSKAVIGLAADGAGTLTILDPSNNADIFLDANGNSYINGGNVGIGTASPESLLHVDTGADGNIIQANGGNAAFDFILKGANGGAVSTAILYELGMYRDDGATSPNTVLGFGRGGSIQNGFFTISQNGSEALRINSSGDVGIGTDNPGRSLEVVDGSQIVAAFRSTTTGGGIGLSDSTTGATNLNTIRAIGTDTAFHTNGSERMRIDSSGNVGIGLTNPATALEVAGDIGIARSSGGYTFRETAGGNERAGVVSNSGNDLIFNTNAAIEQMRILDNGNVGIGETNPQDELHISADNPTIRLEDTVGDPHYSLIRTNNSAMVIGADEGNTGADTRIQFNVDANLVAAMDNTGLGVGTQSPEAPLHVGLGVGSTPSLNGDTVALFQNNAAGGDNAFISILAASTDTAGIYFGDFSSQSPGRILYDNSDDSLDFVTSGSTAMSIDSSGKVAIGTTTTRNGLRVSGDAIYNDQSTGTAIGSINATNSSGNAWNSETKYNLFLENNNNAMSFLVGGTTNNRQAIIQVGHSGNGFANNLGELALNPFGGDVGIGTTNPSQKLDVVGSIEVSDGIYVGGTGAANKFDDYEEGTFNPTLASGFSSGPSGYSRRAGRYTKIGRMVFFEIDIDPDGATASSAGVTYGGLPFTCNASVPGGATLAFEVNAIPANTTFVIDVSTSVIELRTGLGATTSGDDVGMNINNRVVLFGQYSV